MALLFPPFSLRVLGNCGPFLSRSYNYFPTSLLCPCHRRRTPSVAARITTRVHRSPFTPGLSRSRGAARVLVFVLPLSNPRRLSVYNVRISWHRLKVLYLYGRATASKERAPLLRASPLTYLRRFFVHAPPYPFSPTFDAIIDPFSLPSLSSCRTTELSKTRRFPKYRRLSPQNRATSKIPSLHVARIVRGPLASQISVLAMSILGILLLCIGSNVTLFVHSFITFLRWISGSRSPLHPL